MSILSTAAHEEDLGGRRRKLKLRNAEIERFEALHGGIFDLWRQLIGEVPGLKVTACRDLVALALVGGGCPDREAERIVADLAPSENFRLRGIAQRALGLAFFPQVLVEAPGKPPAGSRVRRARPADTTSQPGSAISAG